MIETAEVEHTPIAKAAKRMFAKVKPLGPKKAPYDAFGFDIGAFLCPDAYGDVPGSIVDVVRFGTKLLAWQVKATLFGATYKIVASINGVDFVDLTGQDLVGVNRAIDVVVAVGLNVVTVVGDPSTPAGGVGGAFRFYKLQAKNTVAASVASITGSVVAKR